MTYHAKSDANQPAIVKALRQCGASVTVLSAVGDGCPDLMVGYQGQTYAIEIKTDKGTLTPDQVKWHGRWKGQVAVVHTVLEALQAIGLTKKA
jgi:Holliday junction resolvase